jgi:UDP-3-O-[3-hydroxymyristoyl] N-acetylglucosamine deacetylase
MDGLPHPFPVPAAPAATENPGWGGSDAFRATQRTLKSSIDCIGQGVHSGRKVRLALHPAPPGAGVRFLRTDLAQAPAIPGRYDHVVDTVLCTVLGTPAQTEVRVATVEHLMAAVAALGVDNVLVEVDGPELPIFDGSAEPFLFLIDCAGVQDQGVARRMIQILRPVRVEHGAGFVELRPGDVPGQLDLALSIDFAAAAIGRQALSATLSEGCFRRTLMRARTFTLAADIARMQASGLALGGSLDNAVVVDDARVLNPGGLRMADEFVRHKLLDAIGDLALAGAPLSGRYIGHRAGHRLNNAALRALFASPANWRAAGAPLAAGWGVMPQPAAACPA